MLQDDMLAGFQVGMTHTLDQSGKGVTVQALT